MTISTLIESLDITVRFRMVRSSTMTMTHETVKDATTVSFKSENTSLFEYKKGQEIQG
jgi:hypothetical protein